MPTIPRKLIRTTVVCKLVMYTGYVGESFAQWLLAVFCAERFVALILPLRSRVFFNKKFAITASRVTLLLCSIVCVPILVVYVQEESIIGNCKVNPSTIKFWSFILAYFTTAQKYAYSTIFILGLSFAIAIKLVLIRRQYDAQRWAIPLNGIMFNIGEITNIIIRFMY